MACWGVVHVAHVDFTHAGSVPVTPASQDGPIAMARSRAGGDVAQFRAFVVRLPSGERYWTVINERYRPVPEADDFLLHLRLGRDCAESTTEAYARSVALFLQWCSRTGLSWSAAGAHLGRFMLWLGHYDPKAPDGVVGAEPVRRARRVNQVLAAVREFLKHAAAVGTIDQAALDPLFEVVEDWDLPLEVRGERAPRLRGQAPPPPGRARAGGPGGQRR
jgi:integrase/recombinase XerD